MSSIEGRYLPEANVMSWVMKEALPIGKPGAAPGPKGFTEIHVAVEVATAASILWLLGSTNPLDEVPDALPGGEAE